MFDIYRRSNFTNQAIKQGVQMEKSVWSPGKPEFAEHFPFGQGSVYNTIQKRLAQ